ncbi:MAG: hypothetical protein KAR20_03030, partial [Candidatus Heimdallarchaeota archaeon]|nr:hypothetical protein [Candidatus Heimdallarchaeota archaeon]
MDEIKRLNDSIDRLHAWRVQSNQENLGYGLDEYEKTTKLHYPEAYAKFAKGYLIMYNLRRDEKYLLLCKNALDWLIKNRSPHYDKFCWGLPFEHPYKPIEAKRPFMYTTSLCTESFLDFYEFSQDKRYLDV